MKNTIQVFACLLLCMASQSQTNMNIAYCNNRFVEAAETLPLLYQQKDFGSIARYVNTYEAGCANTPHIFCIKTLLSIQKRTFSLQDLQSIDFYDAIADYAAEMKALNNNSRNSYYSTKHFNATPYSEKIFLCMSSWADSLLHSQELDSTETFLCNVFAGNIVHPEATIIENKIKYAGLEKLIKRSYEVRRSSSSIPVLGFVTGVWVPTGNLKLVGVHPDFGLMFGWRRKKNEIDLTMIASILKTAHNYQVLRNDTLYSRNNFGDGCMGLDYTRYILHAYNFEAGIAGGIGYEYFVIANEGKNQHNYDYLNPLSIDTLNLNTGIRLNYYFKPGLYLALTAKYNFLNYCNGGGTNLQGNAMTLNLTIGG